MDRPGRIAAGQSISVYGENLAYYPSTYTGTNESWIYIEPSGGGGQWVTPTAVNSYRVTFTVPAGLANGTYQVWVDNGHGGGTAGAGAATSPCRTPSLGTARSSTSRSFGATGNGATDDTAAINAAMAAAVPGDRIYFPTGTYYCSSQLITAPAGVRIYGDGPTNSVLETAIKVQSDSKIDDMMVWVPSTYTTSPQGVGAQIWMQNVYFQEDHDPNISDIKTLDIGAASYVFINDCNFTGNELWLSCNNNFYFNGCNFYERFDSEACICSWGSTSLSITELHGATLQHVESEQRQRLGGGAVPLRPEHLVVPPEHLHRRQHDEPVRRPHGRGGERELRRTRSLFEGSTAPGRGPSRRQRPTRLPSTPAASRRSSPTSS